MSSTSYIKIVFLCFALFSCKKMNDAKPDPIADFTFLDNNCNAPCEVSFQNNSKNSFSSFWNFGDGVTSYEPNPKHTFTKSADYNVTLTVYSSDGKIHNSITKIVKIMTPSNIHDSNKQIIPIGGNSWVSNGAIVNNEGLSNWNSNEQICKTYFRVAKLGKLKLSIFIKGNNTSSKIKISILNVAKEISITDNVEKEYFIGEWVIDKIGYIVVESQGISKASNTFGVLTNLGISGTSITSETSFVRNNVDDYFLWGRRGPSVHLFYDTQSLKNIEWFYNEVTVPENNDVDGTYFMANGFTEGYFGMQSVTPTDKRVIFSIWSPYQTDNPSIIPNDYKVVLLNKGNNVNFVEFGGEGSGGSCRLNYLWKTGKTYKFLTQAKPNNDNSTTFTSYFWAVEENKWLLIGSFQRPKTNTYLKGIYSFLENFNPVNGDKTRMAYYNNQWCFDSQGNSYELSKAIFSADDTARKNYRKDYAGGISNNQFFLKNCGFFDDYVEYDRTFSRNISKQVPVIDFSKLP